MSLTLAELKTELLRLCEHDGMEPSGTQATRAINSAYRRVCQRARKTWTAAQLVDVPAVNVSADLGQVAVAMPRLTDNLPKFWEVTEVFYPDTSDAGKLPLANWSYEDGVLYLVDVDTDGVSTVTVRGFAFPEPLQAEADTPDALPPDLDEVLVWLAYTDWAAGYATAPEAMQRIQFYQGLADQKLALWQGRMPVKRRQRGRFCPPERSVSIT